VNPEKSKCMIMSYYEKVEQNHCTKTENKSFEEVTKFESLGKTMTDQNCMHEEINSTLNTGNACCHLFQSLLSSRLLSRKVKVKLHKTIIQPVVSYECET
jgi:hypothetical protein